MNILDIIERSGESYVKSWLSHFSCKNNREIENYLKNSALQFAKKRVSITYLVFDRGEETNYLLGFFTIAYKILRVDRQNISRTTEKIVARYGDFDEAGGSYTIPAPLIAQFGKNSSPMPNAECRISGDELMEHALEQIRFIQHLAGGRVLYLECEDNPFLLDFYARNGFAAFSKRYTDAKESVPFYHQLLKILK